MREGWEGRRVRVKVVEKPEIVKRGGLLGGRMPKDSILYLDVC